MTHLVKCDGCDKVQEADSNSSGDPLNPIDDEIHEKWWSRLKDDKTIHACSRECMDDGMVWPV